MKVLLDRADAALKLRLGRLRQQQQQKGDSSSEKNRDKNISGMEGLVDDMQAAKLGEKSTSSGRQGYASGVAAAGGAGGDEWEVLQQEEDAQQEDEVAIRVDQYLVVFVKFLSTMTPSIEHDYTMGI